MKSWKTWAIVGATVAVALVVTLTVLADDSETGMGIGTAPRRGRATMMGVEAPWRPAEGAFEQGWADELGVTVDRMKEAAATAWGKLIDQAVADGDLTDEQATQLRERPAPLFGERGDFGRGDLEGRGTKGRPEGTGVMAQVITPEEQHAFMADLLGMTPDELQAKLDEGAELHDLIRAAELDMDDVRDASEAFRADEIKAAVEEGLITADQAEQLLSGPQRPMGGRGQHGPNEPVDSGSDV